MKEVNTYLEEETGRKPCVLAIQKAALYVTTILKVLGVAKGQHKIGFGLEGAAGGDKEATPSGDTGATGDDGSGDDGTGEDGSEQVILRCAFEDFGSLQSALEERKIEPVSSGFEWIPKTTTELSEEQMDEVLKLIARLEEDDDVQTVFHNVE